MIEITLNFQQQELRNIAEGLGWSETVSEIDEQTGEETEVANNKTPEEFVQEKVESQIEQMLSRYEVRQLELAQRSQREQRMTQARDNVRKGLTVTRK